MSRWIRRCAVRLAQLKAFFHAGQHDQCCCWCDRLLGLAAVRAMALPRLPCAVVCAAHAAARRESAGRGDYANCRRHLESFVSPVGGSGRASRGISAQLIRAVPRKSLPACSRKRRCACSTRPSRFGPRWPGWTRRAARSRATIRVLACGYSSLPEQFSTACGPLKRRTACVLTLQFESRTAPDQRSKGGGEYAEPAAPPPVCAGLGRAFDLPPCYWADTQDDHPHFCTMEGHALSFDLGAPEETQASGVLFGLGQSSEQCQGVSEPRLSVLLQHRAAARPLAASVAPGFHGAPQGQLSSAGSPEELAAFDRQPVGRGRTACCYLRPNRFALSPTRTTGKPVNHIFAKCVWNSAS